MRELQSSSIASYPNMAIVLDMRTNNLLINPAFFEDDGDIRINLSRQQHYTVSTQIESITIRYVASVLNNFTQSIFYADGAPKIYYYNKCPHLSAIIRSIIKDTIHEAKTNSRYWERLGNYRKIWAPIDECLSTHFIDNDYCENYNFNDVYDLDFYRRNLNI